MKWISIAIGAAMVMTSLAMFVSGLDPLDGRDWDSDGDNDGLNNREEFMAGSDPNLWDTDGDGLPDGWEVDNSLDPTDPSDAEDDSDYFGGEEYSQYTEVEPPYTNYDEYYRVAYVDQDTGEKVYVPTDPNDPDTDGDGILDPDDPYPWDTVPEDMPGNGGGTPKPNPGPPTPIDYKDSDKDGLRDSFEFSIGTDAYNRDTDGDGLLDPMELRAGLDPNDWDTDNDLLIDAVEEGSGHSTDGHVEDTDNDGM